MVSHVPVLQRRPEDWGSPIRLLDRYCYHKEQRCAEDGLSDSIRESAGVS